MPAICCAYHLVSQYEANKMQNEALKTYDVIVNSRIYVNNGKLQLNIGNIHFNTGNYDKAIKLYKMALDKVTPPTL